MRLSQIPEVIETSPGPLHNQPPEPIQASLAMDAEQWAAWMARVLSPTRERVEEFVAKEAEFVRDFGDLAKWDDEIAGRHADVRDEFRALLTQLKALHTIEKEPVLRATRVIDGAANALRDQIAFYDSKGKLLPGGNAPLNRLADRLTKYLQRKADIERERHEKIAAEAKADADRLAKQAEAAMAEAAPDASEALEKSSEAFARADEAQAQATAPAAAMARVRGNLGGGASLRTNWQFISGESNLLDLLKAIVAGKAPLEYVQFNESRIGYAVRSEKVRAIPGCVIRDTQRG